jgi:hypothetical protein
MLRLHGYCMQQQLHDSPTGNIGAPARSAANSHTGAVLPATADLARLQPPARAIPPKKCHLYVVQQPDNKHSNLIALLARYWRHLSTRK